MDLLESADCHHGIGNFFSTATVFWGFPLLMRVTAYKYRNDCLQIRTEFRQGLSLAL